MNPRQEYVRLFTAIVLDVWKERQASAILQVAALEDRLKTLKERKQQLIDALVYRQILAKDDFDEQYAQIKEEMTLTEMHRDELKAEELDVEGVLAFSHYVMLNAARLWGFPASSVSKLKAGRFSRFQNSLPKTSLPHQ